MSLSPTRAFRPLFRLWAQSTCPFPAASGLVGHPRTVSGRFSVRVRSPYAIFWTLSTLRECPTRCFGGFPAHARSPRAVSGHFSACVRSPYAILRMLSPVREHPTQGFQLLSRPVRTAHARFPITFRLVCVVHTPFYGCFHPFGNTPRKVSSCFPGLCAQSTRCSPATSRLSSAVLS